MRALVVAVLWLVADFLDADLDVLLIYVGGMDGNASNQRHAAGRAKAHPPTSSLPGACERSVQGNGSTDIDRRPSASAFQNQPCISCSA